MSSTNIALIVLGCVVFVYDIFILIAILSSNRRKR